MAAPGEGGSLNYGLQRGKPDAAFLYNLHGPHLLGAVSLEIDLSVAQARVLGSPLEKSRTTPDAYPLSLSAPVNACIQKSSREPVMALSDTKALDGLVSVHPTRLDRLEAEVEALYAELQALKSSLGC